MQITPLSSSISRLTYTPLEVGSHFVDVQFEGTPIPNSPFKVSAYDASFIQFSEPPQGIVGRPVEISIDLTSAGDGKLEIAVNGGQVPNTIKKASSGKDLIYTLTFLPKTPVTHMVDMTYNGERVPRCPVYIPILDTSRVAARGEGLSNCIINMPSTFQVDASPAGEADLSVSVTGNKNFFPNYICFNFKKKPKLFHFFML